MKVKDLIAALGTVNPNSEIIMSSDEEGNSFATNIEVATFEESPNVVGLYPLNNLDPEDLDIFEGDEKLEASLHNVFKE